MLQYHTDTILMQSSSNLLPSISRGSRKIHSSHNLEYCNTNRHDLRECQSPWVEKDYIFPAQKIRDKRRAGAGRQRMINLRGEGVRKRKPLREGI
ncbi:hypothetical protein BRADI_4g07568v3 [Brachypodium distachyon]|uniref:Uncharacterized protein n=1 Tax=Brachypodium distachyon TaxID=15368 RepID=A0A2K2CL19_BRADI|nr:hypothetical protein BRADI_4g07568v3 [Brachypodium distachyon]